MRPEASANASDTCRLSDSFVQNHSVLDRVIESAKTAPRGEWVVAGTDRETGRALLADLRAHCGTAGVYRYAETAYRVRVQTSDGTPLTPASANTEAIRGGPPDDTT